MAPSLSDLRNSFWGGGSAAEYAALQDYATQGVTARSLLGLGTGITPLRTRDVSGVTFNIPTNAAWADVDQTGVAAARNMDLVFPGCKVGDWIQVSPKIKVNGGAGIGATLFTLGTVVAGVVTNIPILTGLYGVFDWNAGATLAKYEFQPVWFQVTAPMLDGTNVRVRLRAIQNANPRAVNISADIPWEMEGLGPF